MTGKGPADISRNVAERLYDRYFSKEGLDMKKTIGGKLCFSLLLGALVLLVACGKDKEEAKAPETKTLEPIKLGVAGAHSGDLASYGIPTVRAAQLVVDAVNEKGGVLGRKVELLIEDDACKPENQFPMNGWINRVV